MIKEVRPVFHEELKLLGFDRQFGWVIPEREKPLMWAEGRRYFYRGELVGEARGGSLYALPVLSSYCNGLVIEPVKVKETVEKNAPLLNGLVQKTLRYIYDTYTEYSKGRSDIFYAAFSGGKDSMVLLDLVQRVLPHDAFKVVFADTSMELDDTLKAVESAKARWNDLEWYTAASHLTADESWSKIGPPAEKMRWCCSVHKTAPQVLLMKELAGANSFRTLAFVGVRAEESDSRAAYEMISESKKHIMQISCCPILDWNTSELFLYMFQNNLPFNAAYRKGLTRAGCVFCPMSSKWSFMINGLLNKESTQKYADIILDMSSIPFKSETDRENYFNERSWKLRINGRDLKTGGNKLTEAVSENGMTEIVLSNPNAEWRTWLPAVGRLHELGNDRYDLEYRDIHLLFTAEHDGSNVRFVFNTLKKDRTSMRFMRLFKNALYKSAYCVHCRVCEVECPAGALKMTENSITLQNCSHCGNCLDRNKGCIAAQSLSVSVKRKNTNNNHDASTLNDENRLNRIKDETMKQFTFENMLAGPEYNVCGCFAPDSVYLKQRFIIEAITPVNYKKTAAKVIKQCKKSNIPLFYLFAKNEAEQSKVSSVIRKIFADCQMDVITVDFSSHIFTDESYEKFISLKIEEKYNQNESARHESKSIIDEWKKGLETANLDVYTSDGEIRKCRGSADLLEKLKEINTSVFSCGLEQISTNDTLFKPQGFRETAAQMGVSAAANISGACKYLSNISGRLTDENIWDNPDYYADSPFHAVSQMKLAVEKTIENGFSKNNMVCISDIWETLADKPFGLQNCSGALFIAGFLLKEYADGEHYKFDGANTAVLNSIGLSDLIFGAARENPKMKWQFIESRRIDKNLEKNKYNLDIIVKKR